MTSYWHAVFSESSVHGGFSDTQVRGGLNDVAVGIGDGLEDGLSFDFGQAQRAEVIGGQFSNQLNDQVMGLFCRKGGCRGQVFPFDCLAQVVPDGGKHVENPGRVENCGLEFAPLVVSLVLEIGDNDLVSLFA